MMLRVVFILLCAVCSTGGSISKTSRLLCYQRDPPVKSDISLCSHFVYTGKSRGEDLQKIAEDVKKIAPKTEFIVRVSSDEKELSDTLSGSRVGGLELHGAHSALDREACTRAARALRDALGTTRALLVALPPQTELMAKYYELRELVAFVDLFVVQTQELGVVRRKTFHPSRLSGVWDMLNTDSVVDLALGLGIPTNKLVISSPAKSFKFHLSNATLSTPGSPATEDQPQEINHADLCRDLSSGAKWTLERDQDLAAPYAFRNNDWVAFEDTSSMDVKGKYARVRGLAGLALDSLEFDAETSCGPSLVQVAHKVLNSNKRAPRGAVLRSLENEIRSKRDFLLNAVQISPYRITRVVDSDGVIHDIREDTRTEFTCSRQGFFVHPRSCGRFYRCVKFNQLTEEYTVFEFDCPAGLAFDSRWEVCVWPGSISHGQACPGSSEIAPVPRTRFVCPSQPGYYADPENCRWFFACVDLGDTLLDAYEFRCPFGLGFDAGRLICDWPWLVPACGNLGAYEAGLAQGYSSGNLFGISSHGGQSADNVNIAAHNSILAGAGLDNVVGLQGGHGDEEGSYYSTYFNSGQSFNGGQNSGQNYQEGLSHTSQFYGGGRAQAGKYDVGSLHSNQFLGGTKVTSYDDGSLHSGSFSGGLDSGAGQFYTEGSLHSSQFSNGAGIGTEEGNGGIYKEGSFYSSQFSTELPKHGSVYELYGPENRGNQVETQTVSVLDETVYNGGVTVSHQHETSNGVTVNNVGQSLHGTAEQAYSTYGGASGAGYGLTGTTHHKGFQNQQSAIKSSVYHDNSGAYHHDSSGDYHHDNSGAYHADHSGEYHAGNLGKYRAYDSGYYHGDNSGAYHADNSGAYKVDHSGDYHRQYAGDYNSGQYHIGHSSGSNFEKSGYVVRNHHKTKINGGSYVSTIGGYKHTNSAKHTGHSIDHISNSNDNLNYGYGDVNSDIYNGQAHFLSAGDINVGLVGKTSYEGARQHAYSHQSIASQQSDYDNNYNTAAVSALAIERQPTVVPYVVPSVTTSYVQSSPRPLIPLVTSPPKSVVTEIFGYKPQAVSFVQPIITVTPTPNLDVVQSTPRPFVSVQNSINYHQQEENLNKYDYDYSKVHVTEAPFVKKLAYQTYTPAPVTVYNNPLTQYKQNINPVAPIANLQFGEYYSQRPTFTNHHQTYVPAQISKQYVDNQVNQVDHYKQNYLVPAIQNQIVHKELIQPFTEQAPIKPLVSYNEYDQYARNQENYAVNQGSHSIHISQPTLIQRPIQVKTYLPPKQVIQPTADLSYNEYNQHSENYAKDQESYSVHIAQPTVVPQPIQVQTYLPPKQVIQPITEQVSVKPYISHNEYNQHSENYAKGQESYSVHIAQPTVVPQPIQVQTYLPPKQVIQPITEQVSVKPYVSYNEYNQRSDNQEKYTKGQQESYSIHIAQPAVVPEHIQTQTYLPPRIIERPIADQVSVKPSVSYSDYNEYAGNQANIVNNQESYAVHKVNKINPVVINQDYSHYSENQEQQSDGQNSYSFHISQPSIVQVPVKSQTYEKINVKPVVTQHQYKYSLDLNENHQEEADKSYSVHISQPTVVTQQPIPIQAYTIPNVQNSYQYHQEQYENNRFDEQKHSAYVTTPSTVIYEQQFTTPKHFAPIVPVVKLTPSTIPVTTERVLVDHQYQQQAQFSDSFQENYKNQFSTYAPPVNKEYVSVSPPSYNYRQEIRHHPSVVETIYTPGPPIETVTVVTTPRPVKVKTYLPPKIETQYLPVPPTPKVIYKSTTQIPFIKYDTTPVYTTSQVPVIKYQTTTYRAPEYLPPLQQSTYVPKINYEEEIRNSQEYSTFGQKSFNKYNTNDDYNYKNIEITPAVTEKQIKVFRKPNLVVQVKNSDNRLGFSTVGPDAGIVYSTTENYVKPITDSVYKVKQTTETPIELEKVTWKTRPRISVVTKVNDYNPLLVRKLGAVCSCESPVLKLRGRKLQKTKEYDVNIEYDDYQEITNNREWSRRPIKVEDTLEFTTARIKSTTPVIRKPSITIVNTSLRPIVVTEDNNYEDDEEAEEREVVITSSPKVIVKTTEPNYPKTYLVTSTEPSSTISNRKLKPTRRFKVRVTPAPTIDSILVTGKSRSDIEIESKDDLTATEDSSEAYDRSASVGWRGRDDTIDCQRAGLFRHPKHCNKFYACRWDCDKKKFTLHTFNCPVQLTFDSNLGACNWPSQGPSCQHNTLLPRGL